MGFPVALESAELGTSFLAESTPLILVVCCPFVSKMAAVFEVGLDRLLNLAGLEEIGFGCVLKHILGFQGGGPEHAVVQIGQVALLPSLPQRPPVDDLGILDIVHRSPRHGILDVRLHGAVLLFHVSKTSQRLHGCHK